jgi:PPK2 family polyphosphate:nucleotide phosphotransferase
MHHERFLVVPGSRVDLSMLDPGYTGDYRSKKETLPKLHRDLERLARCHDVLYANKDSRPNSALALFQAMDAAGKDSVVKHVMTGLNPQGCKVVSFKAPSPAEFKESFLARHERALPGPGEIGVNNRSQYEEVVTVRVHPKWLEKRVLAPEEKGDGIWDYRFRLINEFERGFVDSRENPTVFVKFFLHLSWEEQARRLLARTEKRKKYFKYSAHDVITKTEWDAQMGFFAEAMSRTSFYGRPWYIIPADNKWFTRLAVAHILATHLEALNLEYTPMRTDQLRGLREVQKTLRGRIA